MQSSKLVVRFLCLSLISCVLFSASCRKKDRPVTVAPVGPYGKLTVKMSNEVDGQKITFGSMLYTNKRGSRYQVDLLQYYISYFTLIKDDGTEINFKNHKLIDAADSTMLDFVLDSVPNGNYTAVRFFLGVDTGHNHTGLQEGDLDPIHGMIWNWSTGYMFFKHQGAFINDSGVTTGIVYHYGTDPGLATINLPVTKFVISGNSKTMTLKFNLNNLYGTPGVVTFIRNNIHQSTDVNDAMWIDQLKTNFPTAFIFDKVE